ncbi:Stk1 family PASTA domain-containing Ser/Thr kinase [Amycolatopsis nigrescens]|uniref:Stk1 family PASTA domain-containing Ser/Thr kinase n=1 Tax=Amycolatopsis nigrescens TaxID=381445 RepID=UPI00037BFC6B|nr:Stk1 family PASTA domain-containing Ser/Thr kinase [Amycolatopsis nigrescens]
MSTPRLLSNRYELGDTLGYGGMSEVHHGHDVRLGREVAVKILRADLARDPQFQERFRREAQNAAALNHPAIVAVYDTGEAQTEYGPLPYIVMEYVDGRTLRDIVKTEGPMSQKRAMEVMADVSAALDFSHRHGIVHRDVKPANVMITKNGAVKVMDFGIARAIHDGQSAMTQTAAVIGTAQYLSPEQARGESVDARSDVYAAGCVLYELVTGEPPFTGDSPVAVAYQHVREDPHPPSTVNPAVSPELDAIVLKALAKGPANRYQSAAEMRSDMVRALSGQRPSAPMVMADDERTQLMDGRRQSAAEDYDDYDPDQEAEQKRKRRNKMIAGFAVLGIAVIALIMFMLGLFDSKDETKPMPTLKGQQVAAAEQILRDAGLTNYSKEVVPCSSNPSAGQQTCGPDEIDKVISTDPPATSQVTLTQRIVLKVGGKPTQVQVPSLLGMTRDQAAEALSKVGLTLDPNVEEQDVDDQSQYGKVLEQDRAAGTQVDSGTTIKITVGKTKALIEVPDQRGKTYAEAKSALEALKFKVTRKDVDSEKPKEQVTDQKPNGGSLAEGAQVTLEVSNGSKQLIDMPDLRNMTEDQALSALKDAGWSGKVNTQADKVSDDDLVDKVTRTVPGQATKITKDQTITLFIGEKDGSSTPTTSSGLPWPPIGGGGRGGN